MDSAFSVAKMGRLKLENRRILSSIIGVGSKHQKGDGLK